ncbi:hypothetical protein ACFL0P_00295 [Candidatus Omnitrophota bacterium]
MLAVVKFIGIFMTSMGIVYALSPETTKRFIAFWKQGKRLYIGAILNILFGVIFLLAASRCRVVGVVLTMGVLSLAKGVVILMFGLEKMKTRLNWWDKRSSLVLRLVGLLTITIGTLLIYSA